MRRILIERDTISYHVIICILATIYFQDLIRIIIYVTLKCTFIRNNLIIMIDRIKYEY